MSLFTGLLICADKNRYISYFNLMLHDPFLCTSDIVTYKHISLLSSTYPHVIPTSNSHIYSPRLIPSPVSSNLYNFDNIIPWVQLNSSKPKVLETCIFDCNYLFSIGPALSGKAFRLAVSSD